MIKISTQKGEQFCRWVVPQTKRESYMYREYYATGLW